MSRDGASSRRRSVLPAGRHHDVGDESKKVALRYVDILNQGKLDAPGEVLHPNVRDQQPELGQTPGIRGIREYFEMILSAFPDYQLTIEDVLVAGDRLPVRLTMRGTHSGELISIAPTAPKGVVNLGNGGE